MTLAPSHPRTRGQGVVAWPHAGAWVCACVLAEGIGMTAAAIAAVLLRELEVGDPIELSIVVAGGVVEGAALGVLQARALGAAAGPGRRRAWAAITVLVAGLAWAGAAVTTRQEGGAVPPTLLLVLGAAGLGGLTGALLGAAQAPVLRGLVVRHRRWVLVSALAWSPTMVVIFAGASLPAEHWPPVAVLLTGPPTGVLAGAVLGVLTIRLTRLVGIWPSAIRTEPGD